MNTKLYFIKNKDDKDVIVFHLDENFITREDKKAYCLQFPTLVDYIETKLNVKRFNLEDKKNIYSISDYIPKENLNGKHDVINLIFLEQYSSVFRKLKINKFLEENEN